MVSRGMRRVAMRCALSAATPCVMPYVMSVALLSAGAALSAPAKNAENSIPFAEHGGIRDWQANGSKGLWIQAADGRWYYASFSSPCVDLPFAHRIHFVAEPNGDLSRWSSIRLAQSGRCFFRNLQQSAGPPKGATSAQVPG